MKQFKKDLPIYLNGFAVTGLLIYPELGAYKAFLYTLAIVTFFWYGYNQENK
jgi:hypothetical protein